MKNYIFESNLQLEMVEPVALKFWKRAKVDGLVSAQAMGLPGKAMQVF